MRASLSTFALPDSNPCSGGGEVFLARSGGAQIKLASKKMTIDGYYSEIREMGLRRSNIETVYFDREGLTQSVPLPHAMTPEQRRETIDKIRVLQGLSPKFNLN
jgi:hypothetical protein